MKPFVRRSHLVVDVLDPDAVEASWTHNADAVVLALPGGSGRASARADLPRAITAAGLGGAEVFVQVDKAVAHADAGAAAVPGLKGIVYPGAESADEISQVASRLGDLERLQGIPENTLHVIVLLDSGAGVWNIREIVRASERVSSVGLDEPGLCRSLGIVPSAEFDPLEYARGRVVIEARAAGVQPIGLTHPCGLPPGFGSDFDDAEIARLALRSKNLGFAGAVCLDSSWVERCNRAFAPPEDRLEFYRETRRLFAEGVARGTAAIPYPGTTMMIDVPVDENARVNLELWERCAAREAEKAAAASDARSRPES